MFYFAQLKHDKDGVDPSKVDVVRQTIEYRDQKIVKVLDTISTHDTLGEAIERARKLNQETA